MAHSENRLMLGHKECVGKRPLEHCGTLSVGSAAAKDMAPLGRLCPFLLPRQTRRWTNWHQIRRVLRLGRLLIASHSNVAALLLLPKCFQRYSRHKTKPGGRMPDQELARCA